MFLGLQFNNAVFWYQIPLSSLERDLRSIKGMIERNVLVGIHEWGQIYEPNEIHSHEELLLLIETHLPDVVEVPRCGHLYLTVTSLLGEEFHYVFSAVNQQEVLFHAEERKQKHELADYRVGFASPTGPVKDYSEFLHRLRKCEEYIRDSMLQA